MAHFPESFLQELQARCDLVELIGRHVELKKSGSRLVGLCPFHHEKTPSFSVSPDRQLYYCFGCGKGGGVFQFLMEHDGYSFPEAVEYLAHKVGMPLPQGTQEDAAEQVERKAAYALLEQAAGLFARTLAGEQGRPARAYLRKRGLPQTIVQRYRLGYAPEGYGFLQRALGGDGRRLRLLEKTGLLFRSERGFRDRFRARLMFPIRDRRGHVVGFGGRLLDAGEPKYLNSPETPWFHKSDLLYGLAEHRDEIRKRKQLLVVEGYMDVLALAAHGLPIALAPLGTAIGERQLREILRLHDAPVFCFDGDRAGRQAAWRALERMLPMLSSDHAPRFLYLPEGEDPDSLLRQEGAEAFAARVAKQARPVLETWLAGLRLLAGRGPEGRARMAKKADAMLATMRDDYLRQVWRQEAEQASGVRLREARRSKPVAARGSPHKLSELQERFLAGLMQQPSRFAALPDIAREFFVDVPDVHEVYMRAFSIMADAEEQKVDITGQLLQAFPEQSAIARWVNQAPVHDHEFERLCLAMEANAIRARQRRLRGRLTIEQSQAMQLRLREIHERLRGLGEES
ncbi:MAG: DNA primase [Zetaproteobacteria bacterium]|nr:MAG: DNA primase [Zetaproteobacteria bacterium]